MFDGSSLPLEENIRQTAAVAAMAHAAGVSCEGEIGFVGYAGGAASALTDPEDAATFAGETGIDAMAVAVGNVHLQQQQESGIDENAVAAIMRATGGTIPLVIHGAPACRPCSGQGSPVRPRSANSISARNCASCSARRCARHFKRSRRSSIG